MNWKAGWINKILTWLRITNQPVVKVYRGYGHARQLLVQGHVLRRSPLPQKKYRKNTLVNTFAVLRLFFVRAYPAATVRLNWPGQALEAQTDPDGYFKFEWEPHQPLPPGWHPVEVELISGKARTGTVPTTGRGEILVPHPTHYACISDIDDTFLISYSATVWKKLYVLLTENAHSRMPFEGVVRHYQFLAGVGTTEKTPNAFFYVSSSEWNLYDYIREFSRKNGLPEGVYKLNRLKLLHQLLKTGGNSHHTKLERIARILDTFPAQKFILLGDDTQQDPTIYSTLVDRYPNRIRCVYLRHRHDENQAKTQALVAQMEAAGVACCYFIHSAEAMRHSKAIGL
ncbi:MAG: DUF2183 domain-containing protein [Cytophagaceae bacterium]|nr:DUF2183 domain-containing protein [Cytophagaceae bacterium]